MSRTCNLCGKTAARANHVSHSNIKIPRHQKPNLQIVKMSGSKVKACTTCRRTLNKKLAA
ncbi:MAG: bL28 family ribosomal protein [Candidatus Magasanikbacteria bacterium]|nr:bL28 family ribosomal protein [Candidatus Magasanikbacteria bacterium]